MTVLYKGNTAIREIERERAVRSGQIVMTLKYRGLYNDLIAGEPSPGNIWSENSAFLCETANTVRIKGNLGETTVVYAADSSLETIDSTKDIVIEIVWHRNDAPLIFQKAFRDDSVGVQDIECLSLIEDYLQARTASKRATIKALIDAFGALATAYLALRVKGIDSILRFLPIVRKTTSQVLRPSSIGADLGVLQNPSIGSVSYPSSITVGNPLAPGTVTTDSLKYVCMRDDATKTGRNKKWQRIQEWHGYPTAEIQLAMFRA